MTKAQAARERLWRRWQPGRFVAIAAGDSAGSACYLPRLRRRQQQRDEIRSQTDLVTILASVTDANGQPDARPDRGRLSDLRRRRAAENRAFEAETNRPLDLALMVDSSISTFKDLKFETEAAAHFIRQVVRPGDTLGVFEFAETVTRLADFSDDVPKLQTAVRADHAGRGHFDLRRGRAGFGRAARPAGGPAARDRAGDRRRRDDERFEVRCNRGARE